VAFRGSFDYTLDAKNRLTIPAKFRSVFADGLVVARQHDAESCLSIWRTPDFEAFTASLLEGLHPMSANAAAINRFYNTYSHDAELDGAGRIMVPANLLELTGLGKDVVVNGAGNRLEVWGREAWTAEREQVTSTIKRFTAQLGNPA
jgi:MraZ protein